MATASDKQLFEDTKMVTFTYKTYRLDPKSPDISFLAGKYSAISLKALATDPESFGMSFYSEAAFTPSDWLKRVTRTNVHIFICVAHPSTMSPENQTIVNGEWIGVVTQIGPSTKSYFYNPESGGEEPLSDEVETKWHQTAMWIDPAHRGRGVASQLVDTAIKFATDSITGSVQQVRIRDFTGPDNEASKSLYGRRGFKSAGLCTILDAMDQNGNKGYPFRGKTGWSDEILNQRLGVIMERVIKKEEVQDVAGEAVAIEAAKAMS